MASSVMDWTPTNAIVLQNGSNQGVKRTYDNFIPQLGLVQSFDPYAGTYMPGGWPLSPCPGQKAYEDYAVPVSLEAATNVPPANIIIQTAKRICLRIASRLSFGKITHIHQTRTTPKLERSPITLPTSPQFSDGDQPSLGLSKTPQSSKFSTFLSSNIPSTPALFNVEEEHADAHMRNANRKLMNKFGFMETNTQPDPMNENFDSPHLRCADRKLLRKLGLTQTPTPPASPKFETTNSAPAELVDEASSVPPASPFTPPVTPPAETDVFNFFRPAAEVFLRSPYPALVSSLSVRRPSNSGQTPSSDQRIIHLSRPASEESIYSRSEVSGQSSTMGAPAPTTLREPHNPSSLASTPKQNWSLYPKVALQRLTPAAPLPSPELGSSPSAQLLAGMRGLSTRDQSPIVEAHTPDPYSQSPFSPPMSGELSVEQQSRYTTRSVARQKAEAAKHLHSYNIESLSKEWEVKVEHALKHGHGSYTTHDLIKVVPPIGSKTTSQWLNDETINGYLKLVTDLGNKGLMAGATPKYHAFTSFFMTTLLDKGYEGIKRWSKRAKIDGKKLYDVQDVFIPVNRNFHWTMLVVSPKNRTIHYYDSLGGNGRDYVTAAVQWLRGELGVTFTEEDWLRENAAASPMQDNSSDCGVFAITTAKQLMLGRSPMAYGASHIPVQRRRIVAELVAGNLL